MTLQDVAFPVSLSWGRSHALVFDANMAARLSELHEQHGKPDCRIEPTRLVNGKFMLVADVLAAITPGSYLETMWQAADKSLLLPSVEVWQVEDAVALLDRPDEKPPL